MRQHRHSRIARLRQHEVAAVAGKVADERHQRLGRAGHHDHLAGAHPVECGDLLAQRRATLRRRVGQPDSLELAPGYVAHIEPEAGAFHSNFYDRIKGQYLLTAVTHTASGGSFPGATPFAYRNEFEAWPWLVHFFERTAGSTPVGHGSFAPVECCVI